MLISSFVFSQKRRLHINKNGTIDYFIPPNLDSTITTLHFKIKYSLATSDTLNGIPVMDNDSDGVPDFINFVASAVEDVYAKYIDELNFTNFVKFNQPPFPYSEDYYYVYIFNIGKDLGLTSPFHFIGDNPLTVDFHEKNSVSSILYLNNKIENLGQQQFNMEQKIKSTIAHEFFHVIQYGYDAWSSDWLMEATATWSESYIYPNIQMNKNYVSEQLEHSGFPLNVNEKDSLNSNNIDHWYSDWIFFQYIGEHEGNDKMRWIFYYTVLNHNAAYDSSDVSIKSIQDALYQNPLYDNDFGTEFNIFSIANYVKDSPPYNYNDPSLIPPFKADWFKSYFTGSTSRHFDIHRLSSNYHRIAIPNKGQIKITFSEPDDDSIKANVVTISGQAKHVYELIKNNTYTISNPGSFDDIVIVVTNYSNSDTHSPFGGTDLKSYLLDVDMNASLVLLKDYKNSNVSNLYKFLCNDEALMWVEENSSYNDLTTVYFTDRFHSFSSNKNILTGNPDAMLSSLSNDDDELVYAYDYNTKYFENDSLMVWATSDKFSFSVPVLKHRLSYISDSGTVISLGINNKIVYYELEMDGFPFDTYDVWKYDLTTKQRLKITDAGQGPRDGLGYDLMVNNNYVVWYRNIPSWEFDNIHQKAEVWVYNDDNGSLIRVFNIMDIYAQIKLISSSGNYAAWTYMTEDSADLNRGLAIYDLSADEIHYYVDGNLLMTNNDNVAFIDSTGKVVVWNKNIVKTIDGAEHFHDIFLGNNTVGWAKDTSDGTAFYTDFYSEDLGTGIVKSYTTKGYYDPEIIVLGYIDGIFYFEKTDGFLLPEGLYKLNLNSSATGIDDNDISKIPHNFSLDQNYPNPFNQSTTINYHLTAVSEVMLKVYDDLGREVTTLANKKQPPGSYKVQFRPDGLSQGVYYYQLSVNGLSQTHKMLFLK